MRPATSIFATTLALICLVALPPCPASAQTTHHAASKPAAKPMTNTDVLALSSAGLDDDLIIAKIHAAPSTDFDTSAQGLSALKGAGLSAVVIRYMIDPTAPPVAAPTPAATTSTAAPTPPPANNPEDPQTVHPPGIYMLASGSDGKQHLTKLDHIDAKQTKSSGAFLSGMTYGITKAHVKVSIEGEKANVHTHDTSPTFYAYIPEDQNSFGGNPLTIRDFTLIKLDPKATTREVNTATISPWGSSSGTDQKSVQGFTSDSLKPGVYKLTLNKPLPAGQYAFQYHNYGAFFDFGITPSE